MSAMQLTAIVMMCAFPFIAGVIALLAYMIGRMMRNDGWDDSNMTNALRLLSHVTLHPEDFGKMYYLTDQEVDKLKADPDFDWGVHRQPFWYVSKDELSEVVKTRP